MSTSVLVCVDEDDPMLVAYREAFEDAPEQIKLEVAARKHLGPRLNDAFAAHPDEPWYGLLGDDVIPPEVPSWDEVLVRCAGATRLAYPNDGIFGQVIATHPVIGGDAVRAAGFLAYAGMQHYFIDTWWSVLMKTLGRAVYCPGLRIQHLTPMHGHPPDKTYREGQSWFDHDSQVWDEFRMNYSLCYETAWRIEDELQKKDHGRDLQKFEIGCF